MSNGTEQTSRAEQTSRPGRQHRLFPKLRRVNGTRTSAPTNEALGRIIAALHLHRGRKPRQADAVLLAALDVLEAELERDGPDAVWARIDAIMTGTFEEDELPGAGAVDPGDPGD